MAEPITTTEDPAPAPPAGGPVRAGARSVRLGGAAGRRRGVAAMSRFGTLLGLALLVAWFWRASPVFMTAGNWNNILQASAIMGVIACGLTVVLVLVEFDLAVGYTATAAGMLAAGVARDFGTAGALVAAVGLGLLVGLANGLVVTRLGVSAFIATLAAGQVLQGWLLHYNNGTQIRSGLPSDFTRLGQDSIGPVRYLLVVWAVVLVVLYVLLEHTVVGRRMYAVGGNPTAARLSGIRIERVRVFAFVLSGLASGIAGLLLASNLGAGNPTAGLGYLLPAFAACFIGAATLRDGEFHILGTLVGVIILGVLANGLVLVGVSAAWTTAAQGLVLVGAVALSGLFRRLSVR